MTHPRNIDLNTVNPMKSFSNKLMMASMTALMLGMASGANAQLRPPFGGDPNAVPPAAAPGALPDPAAPAGGGFAPAPGGNFSAQAEQDINAQAAGQFPAMDRSSSLPLGAIQNSWNRPMASSGQTAPGVMRFVWRPDFVMPVRTREFMTTTIELPAWEKVDRIVLGDTMVFEATRVKPHIIVIRPSHAGADTNMTLIGTSGNLYNFYLRSEGWNSTRITDLAVYVSANEPGLENLISAPDNPGSRDSLQSGRVSGSSGKSGGSRQEVAMSGDMPDYLREINFDPAKLQFNMRVYAQQPSDIDIAPLRVFSDGVWTYFDYGDKADTARRPVIFQLVDGVETMVNTRTIGPRDNIMVAEAVGDFVLRNGNRVICVYSTEGPRTFETSSRSTISSDPLTQQQQGGRGDYGVPPQLELAEKYKAYSGRDFSGALQAADRQR